MMRATTMTVLTGSLWLAGAIAAAGGQLPGVVPAELARLQGRWVSMSTESDGTRQTGEEPGNLHIISGTEVVAEADGRQVSTATIRSLAPGTPFGTLTLEMTSGPDRGKIWLAIYEAGSTSLRWCGAWTTDTASRPTSFSTQAGDHYFVRTMARARP